MNARRPVERSDRKEEEAQKLKKQKGRGAERENGKRQEEKVRSI